MEILSRTARLALRKTTKFKSTNKIWNDLSLNHGFVIGYLTKLFKDFPGKTYDEWESFYYKSGQTRLYKLKQLHLTKQKALKDFETYSSLRHPSVELSVPELNLNKYYGRTEDELIRIGQFMHKEIVKKGNPLSISEEESILYVYIRVLDDIVIGMEREINTVKSLQKLFPNVTFLDVSIEDDTKFSVDSELYVDKKLKLAIQIKSLNYQKDKQLIIRDTKKFNSDKNDDYTKLKGVKVVTVYSTEFGDIPDSSIVEEIRALLK